MSALLNTLDQLILGDDAVMEQYIFHVVTRTPYENISYTLSAYSTYGRGLPRFQLGNGYQREISTAISQFIPTINGRKDYIIPPLSGMILSDSSGENRVTQFASLYVRWNDYGTIPIGTLRGFEITRSSILDEHSRRAQLKIAS